MLEHVALKTLARRKIEELSREAKRLENGLESEKAFNASAWEAYGSELCGGEMVGNEARIRKEIVEVNRKVGLLRKLVDGKLDLDDENRLCARLELIEAEIRNVLETKSLISIELAEVRTVKGLLSLK